MFCSLLVLAEKEKKGKAEKEQGKIIHFGNSSESCTSTETARLV
jgi:hypothetical protein